MFKNPSSSTPICRLLTRISCTALPLPLRASSNIKNCEHERGKWFKDLKLKIHKKKDTQTMKTGTNKQTKTKVTNECYWALHLSKELRRVVKSRWPVGTSFVPKKQMIKQLTTETSHKSLHTTFPSAIAVWKKWVSRSSCWNRN